MGNKSIAKMILPDECHATKRDPKPVIGGHPKSRPQNGHEIKFPGAGHDPKVQMQWSDFRFPGLIAVTS